MFSPDLHLKILSIRHNISTYTSEPSHHTHRPQPPQDPRPKATIPQQPSRGFNNFTISSPQHYEKQYFRHITSISPILTHYNYRMTHNIKQRLFTNPPCNKNNTLPTEEARAQAQKGPKLHYHISYTNSCNGKNKATKQEATEGERRNTKPRDKHASIKHKTKHKTSFSPKEEVFFSSLYPRWPCHGMQKYANRNQSTVSFFLNNRSRFPRSTHVSILPDNHPLRRKMPKGQYRFVIQ